MSQTKLRFFCGLCKIGCRDENGYKCHVSTDGHIRRVMVSNGSTRDFEIKKSDRDFRQNFLDHLIRRHLGQTVLAYDAYRELFPGDRSLNALHGTCWGNLGSFAAHLKKEGFLEAEKGLKGWMLRMTDEVVQQDEEVEQEQPQTKRRKVERTATTPMPPREPTVPVPAPTKRLDDKAVSFSLKKPVIEKKRVQVPLEHSSDSEPGR